MTETAMELINVEKTIGKRKIINNLSFTVNKGEVFGFLGPNGAGKTTTIRMIVGLMKLSNGDIRICGSSIKTDFKEAVRHVGAIVENPELYQFMSGLQNLRHFARMIPGITEERIWEVVKLLGMEKPIKEKVGRYSLGMRQRLGIAQALLHRPSILILDEPTNGLDPAGIREIRQYIRKLAEEEGVAVIISSHLLSEIELMCDRIGIIKNGELIATEYVRDHEDQHLKQIMIESEPTNETLQVLKREFDFETSTRDGQIIFKCEKADVPNVVKTLIANDIHVYQVNISNDSLEDKFFNLIGENIIE
ncbi:putative ABC transporter ATP-binding protein YhcH [Bacillus sp. J14TS2]|uniref:ABC transporter ATP-binding protein n=1 Tax=Bacillus sp. J14TS2 TaxID=2807188 RepID=UPI001B0B7823|nr:ABC transporter ATP-binding protein [Bacillus sp. J14TS2]GIN72458.1 putative ABC transporter ATP-binding protein YhcH [Bacillus sp. J14TS2]